MTGAGKRERRSQGEESGCWQTQWFDSGSGSSETGWDPVQVLLYHRGRGSLEATKRMAQCGLLFLLLLNAGSLRALSFLWLMSLLCKARNAAWCTELSTNPGESQEMGWRARKVAQGECRKVESETEGTHRASMCGHFFFCTLLYCSISIAQ